jgi:signal peptidase II
MTAKKIGTLLVFLIPWPLVWFLFLIIGRLQLALPTILILAVPEMFCFIGWLLLSPLKKKISESVIIISVCGSFLALCDQTVKLLLTSFYGWERVTILIPGAFSIKLTPNHHGSYIASLLSLEIPAPVYLISYLLIFFVLFHAIRFYRYRKIGTGWSLLSQVFLIAAIIAAAADRIFWSYTVDFLAVKNMFVFDLKDIYANLIALCLIADLVENPLYHFRDGGDLRDDFKLGQEFFRFIFKRKR